MSQKSSLYRTIEILKDLNESKKLCVSRLAQEYEVSDRTIRRDFELIRELFGDFMSKEGECYQAYKKVLLNDVLHATDLMTLANIVNLFGVTQKDSLISEKTKALINKSMLVYEFKSRPFEGMNNHDIVKKLEHTIKFNKEIRIRYKSERFVSESNFHAYKILFLNENFYMVGENIDKHSFEFRRVAMIEDIEVKAKTFIPKADIETFIKKIQTPWANFGKQELVVKLRANKDIRRYFRMKKYLPSQKITKEYENGDILLEYAVTHYHELEELVIKWLPKIEVISPRNFKKSLQRRLKQKLTAISRPINIEK